MQKAPQKVYVVDNGFLASNEYQTSENRGRLLENLVFLDELKCYINGVGIIGENITCTAIWYNIKINGKKI